MADLITKEKRGIAYDLYHGIVELTVLLGRRITGLLWDAICPAAPFYFGAVLAFVARLGIVTLIRA